MRYKELVGKEIKRLDNEIHSMMLAHRAETETKDLTMMHNWVIGFLYMNRDKEIFQKDLEAQFSIARSTATGILQLMEKKGYLYRESVDWDARLKKIVLTQKGIQMHEDHIQHMDRMESILREGLSEEEVQLFLRVVRTMRENLERNHSETDRRRE